MEFSNWYSKSIKEAQERNNEENAILKEEARFKQALLDNEQATKNNQDMLNADGIDLQSIPGFPYKLCDEAELDALIAGAE